MASTMQLLRRYYKESETASCHAPWVIRLGALLAAALSCLQICFLLHLHSIAEEHRTLVSLIDADWQAIEGVQVFGLEGVRLVVALAYVLAWLALATTALGLVSSKWPVATVICVYFSSAFLLAMAFFALFSYALTFSTVLEPVIKRQGEEFCNSTLHWTYQAALNCSASNKQAVAPAGWVLDTCGDDCKKRLEHLERMGGCAMLTVLCHRFQYELVGAGACVVEEAGTQRRLAPPAIHSLEGMRVSERCCQAACNTRVACQGYAYSPGNESCTVYSPRQPKSWVLEEQQGSWPPCPGLRWQPNRTEWPDKHGIEIVAASGSSEELFCNRRSQPNMVYISELLAWRAGASFLATALSLVAASLCGCSLQYTVVTRRRGRKSACNALFKMICASSHQRSQRHHKFGHTLDDGTSSDEETGDIDDLLSDS